MRRRTIPASRRRAPTTIPSDGRSASAASSGSDPPWRAPARDRKDEASV